MREEIHESGAIDSAAVRSPARADAAVSFDRLMTVREAAIFLQRSESWLFDALRRDPREEGSVPHVRLPGRRGGARFQAAELLEWLEAGAPPVSVWRSMRTRRTA